MTSTELSGFTTKSGSKRAERVRMLAQPTVVLLLVAAVVIWALARDNDIIEADKGDDGIIQRNVVGLKEYGFLEVNYTVQTSGGMITEW